MSAKNPGLENWTTAAASSKILSMLPQLSLASPAQRRRFEMAEASGGEHVPFIVPGFPPHGPLIECTIGRPVAYLTHHTRMISASAVLTCAANTEANFNALKISLAAGAA